MPTQGHTRTRTIGTKINKTLGFLKKPAVPGNAKGQPADAGEAAAAAQRARKKAEAARRQRERLAFEKARDARAPFPQRFAAAMEAGFHIVARRGNKERLRKVVLHAPGSDERLALMLPKGSAAYDAAMHNLQELGLGL